MFLKLVYIQQNFELPTHIFLFGEWHELFTDDDVVMVHYKQWSIYPMHTCQVTLDVTGSPIDFNGAPGNIHGNLTGMHYKRITDSPRYA